jgi:hypothetical protein
MNISDLLSTAPDCTLISGCGYCGKQSSKSVTCPHCLATEYCSKAHQEENQRRHKPACEAVSHSRSCLRDIQFQVLQTGLPPMLLNPNLSDFLASDDGGHGDLQHIHGLSDMNSEAYCLARVDLLRALRRIRTRDSVLEQLWHVQRLLKLQESDRVMARIAEPVLLLRLGREQESYDSIRRWRHAGKSCGYDWHGVRLDEIPALPKDTAVRSPAAIFEPVTYFWGEDDNRSVEWRSNFDATLLEHNVALMLLKIRLLFDVMTLRKVTVLATTTLGRRLPQELLDIILPYMADSPYIIRSCEPKVLFDLLADDSCVTTLEAQIAWLYRGVNSINPRYFPCMLDHYASFDSRFRIWTRMGASECVSELRNSYDAWIETPGAMEYLREMVSGDPTSLKHFILNF